MENKETENPFIFYGIREQKNLDHSVRSFSSKPQ